MFTTCFKWSTIDASKLDPHGNADHSHDWNQRWGWRNVKWLESGTQYGSSFVPLKLEHVFHWIYSITESSGWYRSLFLQDTGRWVEHGRILAATAHFKAITDTHHLLHITIHSVFPSLLASTSSYLGYASSRWLKPLSQGIHTFCWFYPGWTIGCSLIITFPCMNAPKYTWVNTLNSGYSPLCHLYMNNPRSW